MKVTPAIRAAALAGALPAGCNSGPGRTSGAGGSRGRGRRLLWRDGVRRQRGRHVDRDVVVPDCCATNTNLGVGTFYEGAIVAAGYASDASARNVAT